MFRPRNGIYLNLHASGDRLRFDCLRPTPGSKKISWRLGHFGQRSLDTSPPRATWFALQLFKYVILLSISCLRNDGRAVSPRSIAERSASPSIITEQYRREVHHRAVSPCSFTEPYHRVVSPSLRVRHARGSSIHCAGVLDIHR